MQTARLLVNIVWRTTIYGLWVGAGVGAIYGWLVLSLAVVRALIRSDEDDLLLMIVSGVFIVLPYGLFFGAVFGAIAGLLLGVLDGVLIAPLTSLYFYLFQSIRGYRWSVGLVVSVATLIGGLLVLPTIGSSTGWSDSQTIDLWGYTIIPAFIAGVAGWWVSQRIADWHEREATGTPSAPSAA